MGELPLSLKNVGDLFVKWVLKFEIQPNVLLAQPKITNYLNYNDFIDSCFNTI